MQFNILLWLMPDNFTHHRYGPWVLKGSFPVSNASYLHVAVHLGQSSLDSCTAFASVNQSFCSCPVSFVSAVLWCSSVALIETIMDLNHQPKIVGIAIRLILPRISREVLLCGLKPLKLPQCLFHNISSQAF